MFEHELVRASQNLRWMVDAGVQFIRALGEVGGSTWADRVIDPRRADYVELIRASTRFAMNHGLRVEWTQFGGGCLSKEHEFSNACDQMIEALRPVRDGVQFYEVQNEGQGPDVGMARQLAGRVRAHLGIPVAITGTPEAGLPAIYQGSQATCYTLHVDRTSGEEGWRWTRQFKHELSHLPNVGINNEPPGIQSSVLMCDDPVILASAAVTTWICNGAAFVLHHGAGIRAGGACDLARGRKANAWEQPAMEPTLALIAAVKRRLPADLPDWHRVTHGGAGHPLTFSTPVGDDIYVPGGVGCNRAYASVAGDGRWLCLVAGAKGRVTFAAPHAKLWSLETGKEETVPPGTYTLSQAEWGRSVLVTSI